MPADAVGSVLDGASLRQWGLVLAGLAGLLATSGWFVTWTLSHIEDVPSEVDGLTQTERDVGRVVGKFENVLVYAFVLTGAYTALAVVFAAKSIVRRGDMEHNSKYYLAGTLANFTFSLVVGIAVRTGVQLA
ncbi:hypothetical protein [Halospeciosus flavus]|uniref:DUF4234 domain-containing protein n=1 Tax=Halospeciosus flavus TaxID=3032283 RepID=A0ABD5Z4P5_9EURY|nr:hypothetical protein [Halospeciosus flavus]